jgi:hypothetical protein
MAVAPGDGVGALVHAATASVTIAPSAAAIPEALMRI